MSQIKRQELRFISRIKQMKAPGRCSGQGSCRKRSNNYECLYQPVSLSCAALRDTKIDGIWLLRFHEYSLTEVARVFWFVMCCQRRQFAKLTQFHMDKQIPILFWGGTVNSLVKLTVAPSKLWKQLCNCQLLSLVDTERRWQGFHHVLVVYMLLNT